MDNDEEFLQDMQRLRPDIIDYFEALVYAMEQVNRYDGGDEILYFGTVADGVFFSGGDFDRCRWFPETSPVEAIGSLEAELGEQLVEPQRASPSEY